MTSNTVAQLSNTSQTWLMPVRPEQYPDRSPVLTDKEKALMNEYILAPGRSMSGIRAKRLLDQLARFDKLYLDTVKLSIHCTAAVSVGRRHLFQWMIQTEKAFWAWPHETWIEVIHAAPIRKQATGTRFWMLNLAYLVCDFLYVGASTTYGQMADAIFGLATVDAEVDKLHTQLITLGYSSNGREKKRLRWLCALVLLANRSPHVEMLSPQVLRAVDELLADVPSIAKVRGRQYLLKLQTALCHLNILDEPVLLDMSKPAVYLPTLWKNDTSIDPTWLAWISAFFEQTPCQHDKTIRGVCYTLFTAGRWLKKAHPDITEPARWTEEIANEYVSYTCDANRGDQALPSNMRFARYQTAPQKLSPKGINARLAGMRFFFSHLQRRTYVVDGKLYPKLQITWLSDEAFKTPADIKAAIQPNPRDIQEDTWFKLIWAACTLTKEKLLEAHITQYPLAYYRAACLVWVTAARRSDEIRRLSVGCVSREWAPEMDDEQGNQIEPEAELCYIRVPTNKMKGDFYIPVPTYVADAIEVWESVRPPDQIPLEDRKTRKPTRYLFQYRDELMGSKFLNDSAIPLLCKLAGVSQMDIVGRITSHRARATTATWMRKMGMVPTDIGKLLGHTNPAKSLPWYLREDKHHLGRVYRKANPLERYVAAILDTNAQAKQEPCVFYYLADGPDGRPRMCGNPHFSHCIHQMTCRECEAFIDTEMAEVIEKREGAIIISVPIPLPTQMVTQLNEQDEAGNDEVQEHFLPPPELPGPAFHFNKKVPLRSPSTLEEDLRAKQAFLEAQIAKKQGTADRRSASMKALMQELAEVKARIAVKENGL